MPRPPRSALIEWLAALFGCSYDDVVLGVHTINVFTKAWERYRLDVERRRFVTALRRRTELS